MTFFDNTYSQLIDSPNNSELWWHSVPMPDGSRINGYHADKSLQLKMWEATKILSDNGLKEKIVLDIGANDGFFSIASLMAGAKSVTSIDKDWITWPKNISFLSQQWNVDPNIITGDFRAYEFDNCFDVIIFFGVLYHVEDIFSCMKRLSKILKKDGEIFMETQMSQIYNDLPLFEFASDTYPTIARQGKESLEATGISNYLFPNEAAIYNLADSYDFKCEAVGENSAYEIENPSRRIFRFFRS